MGNYFVSYDDSRGQCPYFEVMNVIDLVGSKRYEHIHDFIEISIIKSGTIDFLIGEKHYNVGENDIVIIKPGEKHYPTSLVDEPFRRSVIWLKDRWLDIARNAVISSDQDSFLNIQPHIIHASSETVFSIENYVNMAIRELIANDHYSVDAASAYLVNIIINIQRSIADDDLEETSIPEKVMDYINQNIFEDLSLEKLASKFFVSKYYLCHSFYDQYTISIHKYITGRRLSVAKEMLTVGKTPQEVCKKCGYKSYSSFFKAFKAQYGISPVSFQTEK